MNGDGKVKVILEIDTHKTVAEWEEMSQERRDEVTLNSIIRLVTALVAEDGSFPWEEWH
jgi:hypothetical protein